MEQSMDIDQHISMFRSEALTTKLEEQKYNLEDLFRKKVKEQRLDNNKNIEQQKEAIQQSFQKRLQDDRNLEHTRNQLDLSQL